MRPKSFRLSTATAWQLEELSRIEGMTQTQVVTVAIDRMMARKEHLYRRSCELPKEPKPTRKERKPSRIRGSAQAAREARRPGVYQFDPRNWRSRI
jgi:hypothetical protein